VKNLKDDNVGIQNPVAVFLDRKRRDKTNRKLHSEDVIARAEELYSMVCELFFASRCYLNYNEKSVVVKISNARQHHARVNNRALYKQFEQFCATHNIVKRTPNSQYTTNVTLHVSC